MELLIKDFLLLMSAQFCRSKIRNTMQKPNFKTILVFFSVIIILGACKDDNKDYNIEAKTYETQTAQLAKTENKMPQRFLKVQHSLKKNILGQTVVSGRIFNTAKIASYKNIELKLQFYSKTRVLLEEDLETIYEKIAPGESTKFKSKYFTPKGTDSVSIIVEGAANYVQN